MTLSTDDSGPYASLTPAARLELQECRFALYIVDLGSDGGAAQEKLPVVGCLAMSDPIRLVDLIELSCGGVNTIALKFHQFVRKFTPIDSMCHFYVDMKLVDDDAKEDKDYQTQDSWDEEAWKRSVKWKDAMENEAITHYALPVPGGKARIGSRVPATSMPSSKPSGSSKSSNNPYAHGHANNIAILRDVVSAFDEYLLDVQDDEEENGSQISNFVPGSDAECATVLKDWDQELKREHEKEVNEAKQLNHDLRMLQEKQEEIEKAEKGAEDESKNKVCLFFFASIGFLSFL